MLLHVHNFTSVNSKFMKFLSSFRHPASHHPCLIADTRPSLPHRYCSARRWHGATLTQLSLGPLRQLTMVSSWRPGLLPPILLSQILSLLLSPYHDGTAGQQCRLTSPSRSQDATPDDPFPSGSPSGNNGTNGTTIPEGTPFVYGTDVIRGVNLCV